MTQITISEKLGKVFIPCWTFFCNELDEKNAVQSGSKDEAVKNILGNNTGTCLSATYLLQRVDKMVGTWLKGNITETQLRGLYNVAKSNAGMGNKVRIQLIYIASRQTNPVAKSFVELINALLDEEKDFNNSQIVDFIESVLSYHKYYSKK